MLQGPKKAVNNVVSPEPARSALRNRIGGTRRWVHSGDSPGSGIRIWGAFQNWIGVPGGGLYLGDSVVLERLSPPDVEVVPVLADLLSEGWLTSLERPETVLG